MKVNKYLMRKAREDPERFKFKLNYLRGKCIKTFVPRENVKDIFYRDLRERDLMDSRNLIDFTVSLGYLGAYIFQEVGKKLGLRSLMPRPIDLITESFYQDESRRI